MKVPSRHWPKPQTPGGGTNALACAAGSARCGAFRFANITDVQCGYKGLPHGQNRERAGKWAARLTAWLLGVTCGLRWAEVAP
ncbi:MAG TPA: hypothetical protein PLB25_04255 [Rhodoferax sp.]|nr:hypothetical protein [Rhodoferax sp.]